mmetsp:Transcript_44049/g.93754  ORF Transcript_44049/g.93754 Transcript_44049/m.93754 type:complete len:217 (+) Transcript_44049:1080-1730(+)
MAFSSSGKSFSAQRFERLLTRSSFNKFLRSSLFGLSTGTSTSNSRPFDLSAKSSSFSCQSKDNVGAIKALRISLKSTPLLDTAVICAWRPVVRERSSIIACFRRARRWSSSSPSLAKRSSPPPSAGASSSPCLRCVAKGRAGKRSSLSSIRRGPAALRRSSRRWAAPARPRRLRPRASSRSSTRPKLSARRANQPMWRAAALRAELGATSSALNWW